MYAPHIYSTAQHSTAQHHMPQAVAPHTFLCKAHTAGIACEPAATLHAITVTVAAVATLETQTQLTQRCFFASC